ncbi:MAG: NmrA family NAD(P)-binding protein [Acidobacteria bacterium]|nr:NmrA family NAD(P)-binding protein [Acidobacteriota bacterium]
MKRILVIGSTGTVGRQVVSQLDTANVLVRALTRNPASTNLPLQAEIVYGDLTIPDSLDQALNQVDAVFLVWTAPATAVQPAIERIARHVRRIVFLSSPHQTAHPFFQQPNPMATMHKEIERLIQACGFQWTFLRPGMFAVNCLSWWTPQIREGNNVVRWPYGEAPTAPIHERDIAAVGIQTLCEEGHDGKDYVLTGPESLTQSEQVRIIGEVIGRPLRFEEISPDEAQRELLTVIPPPAVTMLLNAWAAALGRPAYVTTAVEDLTGTPARSFRDWVQDHASEFWR